MVSSIYCMIVGGAWCWVAMEMRFLYCGVAMAESFNGLYKWELIYPQGLGVDDVGSRP